MASAIWRAASLEDIRDLSKHPSGTRSHKTKAKFRYQEQLKKALPFPHALLAEPNVDDRIRRKVLPQPSLANCLDKTERASLSSSDSSGSQTESASIQKSHSDFEVSRKSQSALPTTKFKRLGIKTKVKGKLLDCFPCDLCTTKVINGHLLVTTDRFCFLYKKFGIVKKISVKANCIISIKKDDDPGCVSIIVVTDTDKLSFSSLPVPDKAYDTLRSMWRESQSDRQSSCSEPSDTESVRAMDIIPTKATPTMTSQNEILCTGSSSECLQSLPSALPENDMSSVEIHPSTASYEYLKELPVVFSIRKWITETTAFRSGFWEHIARQDLILICGSFTSRADLSLCRFLGIRITEANHMPTTPAGDCSRSPASMETTGTIN